jgi:hypothetical protein
MCIGRRLPHTCVSNITATPLRVVYREGMYATCSDCPKCGRENLINTGTSHIDPHSNACIVTCKHCGHVYKDDDLVLREKTAEEIARNQPVTTVSWA